MGHAERFASAAGRRVPPRRKSATRRDGLLEIAADVGTDPAPLARALECHLAPLRAELVAVELGALLRTDVEEDDHAEREPDEGDETGNRGVARPPYEGAVAAKVGTDRSRTARRTAGSGADLSRSRAPR